MKSLCNLLLGLLIIISTSCDSSDPTPKTRLEIITSGSWKLSQATLNSSNSPFIRGVDGYQIRQVYVFEPTFDYVIKNSSTPVTNKWRFENNDTTLVLDNSKSFIIDSMSPNKFVVTYSDAFQSYTLTFTR